MSFCFVVETGTADPASNAYVSVEAADDWIQANTFQNTGWFGLDDNQKQYLLVRSSKYLDIMVDWFGQKVSQTQGLRWPRAEVCDGDGFEIPDNIIPLDLQNACAEMATYFMNDDWSEPQSFHGMTELEVDSIKIEWNKNYVRAMVPQVIVAALSDLGTVNKGTRPAFKKIYRT